MLKDMFSFLKPKQSGSDIAAGVFNSIQRQYDGGFPASRGLLSECSELDTDAEIQEWLYLQIFAFDFATYNALGQTPARSLVLTPFLGYVKAWLKSIPVPELPERIAMAIVGPELLRTIPAEPAENALLRLSRRTDEYASAIAVPNSKGEKDYSVAAVFAARTGATGLPSVTAVAAYFSVMVSETTKMLTSARIIP